jgi:phage-related protein
MRAKAFSSIELLGEMGISLREPYVKAIKGPRFKGLWELRVKFSSDIVRIFYFTYKHNNIILLHGFIKKTEKSPINELERALRFKTEFERRNGHA